jgi:hypothetical protein
MSSETAWKACLFRTELPPRDLIMTGRTVRLSLAHRRMLQAYRAVKLPGQPQFAALARLAKTDDETIHRALDLFRAHGLLP